MLVPANFLPAMHVEMAGRTPQAATIYEGVVVLVEEGMWGLAAIVFTASIFVPFLKLVGLGWLLTATRRPGRVDARRLTGVYRVVEFIGPWSMLDVFLVGFLCGAVRFGRLASVEPGPGIVAFGAAVVLTMFATRAFDPRWLWRQSVVPELSIQRRS
jgi:paraquat-inducible protein A